jgi:hypothetical protein
MNMDFATMLVRLIGDTLFSTPATYSTKDIYDRIQNECETGKVTQCVLKAMFCENTGAHYLDSGGAYGRGWERAQAIKDLDWTEFPPVKVEVDKDSFYILKNTYQLLCDVLEYDIEMDKIFHKFCNQEIRKRDSYYSNMNDFVEHLKKWDIDFEDKGGYNTYNGDSCLDKTLQWNMFSIYNGKYEGDYLLLQIHNGCDVRGGYSTPHVFRFDEDDFWWRLDDLSAYCPNRYQEDDEKTMQVDLQGKKVPPKRHVDCYSDDGGYHWYEDNDFEFITDEDGEHHVVCGKCGLDINFY